MELTFEKFDYRVNLVQQRELFNDAFPEATEAATDENYKWLLHSFPNDVNPSFEFCGYHRNEMVGYYAAIPFKYKIGDDITDVGMVCGVMTSSKYRGKGIFTQMGGYSTEKLAEHVPFTTGYPIRKSVIPGHLKIGWKIAFELPLFMKFLSTDSLLKSKLPKFSFLSPILNFFLDMLNLLTRTRVNSKFHTQIFNSIDSIKDYDVFISKWMKSIPNALFKDSVFAQWRYGKPNSDYRFLVISHKDEMIGFVSYCSVIKEGVPSYCLLDLSVLPGYYDCLGVMYNALFWEAKKNGIEAIMMMMSKYSARKYRILRNAFLRSPFTFYLIIKNLTNRFSDEQLFKEENWHLMWVDSDDL